MLGFLPWRGTLYGKPGGRIPQDFFVGEPGFDKYTAEQRSLGYQFEHAFNDTVTVRQNLRYTHSKVDYRSVYTAGFNGAGHGWVPGSDTLLRRTIYLNQPTLDQFVVDTQGQFASPPARCGIRCWRASTTSDPSSPPAVAWAARPRPSTCTTRSTAITRRRRPPCACPTRTPTRPACTCRTRWSGTNGC